MAKEFTIERLECGVWETQDYADTLEDALTLASAVCFHPCCQPEQCWDCKIQVVDAHGKIL